MAGKGDSPRPRRVPRKVYETNWERVFGKKYQGVKGLGRRPEIPPKAQG